MGCQIWSLAMAFLYLYVRTLVGFLLLNNSQCKFFPLISFMMMMRSVEVADQPSIETILGCSTILRHVIL